MRRAPADNEPGEHSSLVLTQFLARVYSIPGEKDFLKADYYPVRRRFVLALQMCLRGLPSDDLLWRYNMFVGPLMYAMNGPQRMTRRPLVFGIAKSTVRPKACIRQMTALLVSGFHAPRHDSESAASGVAR
ncbi:hypothetical protein GCM10007242_27730 [Pigmentiphaga litoralis]|uniref:hypothetical protein n=1 Tax=Pigmentiphaga litoralis TaxID=516702 RepID=UPI001676090C|nr:hypothetical protein [Pigmentiphaga litoralis]GGX19336.1 hypothetical protein GCM10007242_27730 [Pigmentiphaga litoralis]